MMIAVFLLGCVAGFFCAAGILLFTDLGWTSALIAYFGIGYGLPLAVMAATSLSKRLNRGLQTTDIVSR